MTEPLRLARRYALALAVCFSLATAARAQSPAPDCSVWTLDGYHVGMLGDEILAVRSVTLHMKGQAQVVEPGKFSGVLVLDDAGSLEKWDVRYEATDAPTLRAEMRARYGEPASDDSWNALETEAETVIERRTIWRSRACDAAIVVEEGTAVRGKPFRSVRATLGRSSRIPAGVPSRRAVSASP